MDPEQQPAESPVSLRRRYAILNLDLMSILIDAVWDTDEGQTFISSCVRWNDAVHRKDPRPLTIFTSVFFSTPSQPELAHDDDMPFSKLVRSFDTFQVGSPGVQIYSRFVVDEKDIALQKTTCYAGAGNAVEQILKGQNIDSFVIPVVSVDNGQHL